MTGPASIATLANVALVAAAQFASAAVMFAFFFRLQAVGDRSI